LGQSTGGCQCDRGFRVKRRVSGGMAFETSLFINLPQFIVIK
jgi:hypothetical protein